MIERESRLLQWKRGKTGRENASDLDLTLQTMMTKNLLAKANRGRGGKKLWGMILHSGPRMRPHGD